MPAQSFPARRGFGLLELATSLAFLVIVLGLMVSLARYVRAASAEQITRQILRQLNDALAARTQSAAEPPPAPEPPADDAGEAAWLAYARQSNTAVRQLASQPDAVTDAWGNPVAYLASQRPRIGMAPHDRPFCVSAGPDGRYLTPDDNLYSYEQLSTAVPPGGHRE